MAQALWKYKLEVSSSQKSTHHIAQQQFYSEVFVEEKGKHISTITLFTSVHSNTIHNSPK